MVRIPLVQQWYLPTGKERFSPWQEIRTVPCSTSWGNTSGTSRRLSVTQKLLPLQSAQACVPLDAFLQGGCLGCFTPTSLTHPHQFCGNFKAARPRFDTPLIWRSLYSSGTHNAAQCWPTQRIPQLSPCAVLLLWRRACHHQLRDVAAHYCSQALAGDDDGRVSRTASVDDGPPSPIVLRGRE